MKYMIYAILSIYLITKASGHPVRLRQRTKELFMETRVRRQTGYVYDKPSVSFDLPTRASSSTVTTQAPTVDRTQAQMMYYAYPAPASGGNAFDIGATSGASGGGDGGATATASAGSLAGYSYGAPNAGSTSSKPVPTTGILQVGSVQSSRPGSAGYDYNTPSVGNGGASSGSAQASGRGSLGYGYNAPPAGGTAVSNGYQTSNAGSSQATNTGSNIVSAARYEYNVPSNTQGLVGTAPSLPSVSTSAPGYLPPSPNRGNLNNKTPGLISTSTGAGTGGAVSGSSATVTQPLDQYLPPAISKPSPPVALADEYLPPNIQPNSPASTVSNGSPINKEVQGGFGPRPSPGYIPPSQGQATLPVNNATPRPFAPAPPSAGYLPPVANPQAPALNSPSTPASSYLPPVL